MANLRDLKAERKAQKDLLDLAELNLKSSKDKVKIEKEIERIKKGILKLDKQIGDQEKKNAKDADKRKKAKEAEFKTAKAHSALDKKTRNLSKDYAKYLKSNAGSLMTQLGLAEKTSQLEEGALGSKRKAEAASKLGHKTQVKEYRAQQEAFNLAFESQKMALAEMEMGTFDADIFMESLETQLSTIPNMTSKAGKEALEQIRNEATKFKVAASEAIEAAGDEEEFAKKFEIQKSSMAAMDEVKDKVFNIKSFVTDSNFRKTLMKGFFIGLAVKAAGQLWDALKGTFDTMRELGISFNSIPIAAGFAREEAEALLDTFGTLEGVTNANLIAMKWNAYWYGVAGADSAKLLKLQMSITDSTKEMALEDQRDFMKELKKEGLSASKVMADMAGNADFVAKYMKDGGDNMRDAAKYAASLGMDLGVAESMADKLLDYESSIAAEMEASMILGRSINLDKARQLAYTGEIEAMMREVKLQAGGEAEFAKMTSVQRESLGDAIGLQGSQLAEFMKTEEERTEALNSGLFKKMGLFAGIAAVIGVIVGAIIVGLKGLKGMADMGKGALLGAKIGTGAGALGGAVYHGVSAQGKARGGPVQAGNPYIVGEKRAELFVPGVSGNILPSVPGMVNGSATFPDMSKLEAGMERLVAVSVARKDEARDQARKLGGQVERSGGQY